MPLFTIKKIRIFRFFIFSVILILFNNATLYAGKNRQKKQPNPPIAVPSSNESTGPLVTPAETIKEYEQVNTTLQSMAPKKPDCDVRQDVLSERIQNACTGKYNLKKICSILSKDVGSAVSSTVLSAATAYCSLQIMKHFSDPQNGTSAMAQMGPAMIIGQTLSAAVDTTIKGIMKAIAECKTSPAEGLHVLHQQLILESQDYVKTIPADFQARLKRLDEVDIPEKFKNTDVAIAVTAILKKREILLSMPFKPKNVAQYDKNGDPELRRQIDDRVQKLLNKMPEEHRETLEVVIQKIRDNSILKDPTKVQFYLYGLSGTGKSTFIRELGEALGLHICFLKIPDEEDSNFERAFFGSYDKYYDNTAKDHEFLGRLGRCMLTAGHTNPLIVYEEAGEQLEKNSDALKRLLDPDIKWGKLNGMSIDQDIARFTTAFLSNKPLTNAALRTRVPQISLLQLGKKEKTDAAETAWAAAIKDLKEVLPDREVEAIDTEARKYFDFIIETDVKVLPGARAVKGIVKDFINFVRIKSFKKQIPLKKDEAHAYILKIFENAKGEETL